VIGIFDVDVNDGVIDARADRIKMTFDLSVVSPLIGLQIVPEAQPANTQ
jgi:hypothetical protein